jgi:hypothetical protein
MNNTNALLKLADRLADVLVLRAEASGNIRKALTPAEMDDIRAYHSSMYAWRMACDEARRYGRSPPREPEKPASMRERERLRLVEMRESNRSYR